MFLWLRLWLRNISAFAVDITHYYSIESAAVDPELCFYFFVSVAGVAEGNDLSWVDKGFHLSILTKLS